ncbi:Calcium-activated outward-rectifying potassium channel putative isoform 1 [Tripterygium wilfordii]|uniref:Calcium-activated outward-rectifying potassium channel putative isoform 1 n=1 Tax=Tripterygium wilfordii TaxID=458696 RepID=A0A7J7CEF9_TRIWF|nr:two-pore potassium channel 3-like isoform X1 [Tripterygium wilfordii]XP_038680627.1 two-pore potassium channel 3-like isoform X1 [Tripterygium wilfordii]KAF5732492.1 Calcium-activated outward-rectifying potassium channel putative isoform 1 [Tripterygium wilfordii]
MDELFLSKSTGFEAESSRPSPRREFPPGYLDFITNDAIIPIITTPKSSASFVNLIGNLSKNRKGTLTRRSHSAPSVFTDIKQEAFSDDLDQRAPPKSTPWIVRQAFVVVILYIIAGIVFYLTSGSFKGTTTFKPVDAAYFSVVTLCTIGYGDIVPDTTFTKLFTCAFILVGFGFIDILLNGLVTYICDRQEAVLLSTVDENRFNTMMQTYMIDKAKGRMRIRMKVGLALAVVIGCIAVGTVMVHFLEDLNWVDSFYLSVTSVTTVGYGDYAFTTLTGRCFAIIWLLVSTLAVARAFLYLAELRSDRRNRRIAQWVLQKKMTLGDLVAADLDNDGCISKSEFVIFKLREMGKIAEKDILEICKQFDSIDNSNHGKITLADLMGSA